LKRPVFAYDDLFAHYGAVLILSADIPTVGRQAAELAAGIIANRVNVEKIQNPAGSQITLNMKKVEEYGIRLDEDALASVNRIIE